MLAQELVRNGVDTHVACLPTGDNLPRLLESGCTFHALRTSSSYDPRLLTQLIGLIRRVKPDVVQTWLPQMDVAGGVAAFLTGVPFILSERSSAVGYPPSFRVRMRNAVAPLAAAIAANSNAGRDYWQDRTRRPIHVIRNGLLPSPHTRAPAATPLILFVGRYHYDKCAVEAGQGIAMALRQQPQARALFVGNGPDETALRAIAEAEALKGRMTIAPFTRDVRRIMAESAVFVSVSRYEGHPNAVIEAAMVGVPLVLSDIAAHREMFGAKDCIYVDGWSSEAICASILDVLRDPAGAAGRASSARDKVQAFSPDTMVDRYIKLYRSVQVLRK
jgi:glycosyltransferase involved in cell wall biosynthesis